MSMYLPAWMDGLTPKIAEKAELELGETPDVMKKSLKQLTRLLEDEPGLNSRLDEKFLIRYLRAKKYNIEKAFKTLLNYYAFKAKYTGIFTNFQPSELAHVLDMNCTTVLPLRDADGASIGLVRFENFDVKAASAEEFVATSLLCAEVGLEQEATLICGSVILMDLKGISMTHMRHFSSATLLSLMVSSCQDCMAYRVKGIHVVNEPYYFNVLFQIVKKFLNKKLRERFHFHGNNLRSLHKYIPPEILPKYLGGRLLLNYEEYRSLILSKEEYFETINKYGRIPD